jgi:hypothetical protein
MKIINLIILFKSVKHQRDNIVIDAMYSNSDNELLREFVYKSYLTKNLVQSDQFDAILYNRQVLFLII